MAAADYAVQRRRTGKQVRMTKKEVKQEHKQSEGDPHDEGRRSAPASSPPPATG